MALVIKYKFHDSDEEDAQNWIDPKNSKKRKTTDAKTTNVIEYSAIKLPALMFGQYLDQDGPGFVDDCTRLAKKKNTFELCFLLIGRNKFRPLPRHHFSKNYCLASRPIQLSSSSPLHRVNHATPTLRNSTFIKSHFCDRYYLYIIIFLT